MKEPTRTLSLAEARVQALQAQGLWATPATDTIEALITRLGYVQIDTIAVVERAHHHVLWTRRSDYHPDVLHRMQAVERSVFEYWGHAMSYLPMAEYKYVRPRMRNFQNPKSPWAVYQLSKAEHLLEPVLERIRQEGPLSASDFESQNKMGGSWC